jgi:hypothetical protein
MCSLQKLFPMATVCEALDGLGTWAKLACKLANDQVDVFSDLCPTLHHYCSRLGFAQANLGVIATYIDIDVNKHIYTIMNIDIDKP